MLLFLVVSLAFVLLHVAPGNPTDRLSDPRIPDAQRQRLAEIYGYDQPLPSQYLRWLAAVSRGDLGYSHLQGAPVTQVLRRHLPPSLLLGVTALLVSVPLGLSVGLAGARRPGGVLDRGLRLAGILFYSIPGFWLGILFIMVFALRLGWFPSSGMRGAEWDQLGTIGRLTDLWHHLCLPAAVLAIPLTVEVGRYVRQGLLDVKEQEFLVAARARGLPERRLWLRHALRHALGPVCQLVGTTAPALLAGALVTEVVFSWPGLGSVTAQAVFAQDGALVLAVTLLSGVMVVFGTLLADLAQGWLDPRARRASEARP